MVLVAASLGLVLFAGAGISATQAAIVADAASGKLRLLYVSPERAATSCVRIFCNTIIEQYSRWYMEQQQCVHRFC